MKNKTVYFEGWYFKHQINENIISFIPGTNIDIEGKKTAFIQVITDTASYNINYPYNTFKAVKCPLSIKVGDSRFTDKGAYIDIKDKDLTCKGNIEYGKLTPIKYNIMGPFSFIPFMECNHGIISLFHTLFGNLSINSKAIDFKNGIGYIENDYGSSFPKSYLWIQCNNFIGEKCSVTASIANIPFIGFEFKGCICIVLYKETEYRLATYNGVKIIRSDKTGIILKQGKLKLVIDISQNNGYKLLAPQKGSMSRTIHESIACKANFKFYINDILLFNHASDYASFEYMC